ncbi:peptidoglycan-binding domain-containing protein, partial [Bacillus paralicheniformis]|uniref:peptidoglycan-binding domain-containing protein n=1 Tax=Bacillus paralicheniformis TaxID=1648923 RepID=UPI002DB8BE0C
AAFVKNVDSILGNKTKSEPKKKAPKKGSAKKPAAKKYPLPTGIYKYKSPMMKGTAVRQIQEACAAVYYYPDKGAKNNGIDGYYGPKTANAVKRFQLMHGLSADGIYGPKTKAKLEALLK